MILLSLGKLGLGLTWVVKQVWTEVYSEHAKRWIHVDACEEAWNQPRLYAEGWGKQMAYCIAFAHDGVTDVTRRYVRNPRLHALPRQKCPEEVLLYILNEIRGKRRDRLNPEDIKRLEKEDRAEDRELQTYVTTTLAGEEKVLAAGGSGAGSARMGAGVEKRMVPRQSGEWNYLRGWRCE